MEQADGVRAAADAGHGRVRQSAHLIKNLRSRLHTDDALKIADHHRKGVRSSGRTEAVIGVVRVGYPVTHRVVYRVLQGFRPRFHRHHGRSQQPHPRDIEGLPCGVDRAHVDHAFQAQQRACGGGGNTVLPGTGLGDHTGLAHLLGQQNLTENIVDLVRTSVVQVFSFEKDTCAAGVSAKSFRFVQRRWASHVVSLQAIELVEE